MTPPWTAACVASPFDGLRVTPMQPPRGRQSSVILSLSKETRATHVAAATAAGPYQ
jgi:hypothetical protein